uniref:Succinate dehydrogenase subunit 7B-like isoform X1 n=1 Tax=Rhizophora mucronata TaxID=61149 RepID=A0A2P2JF86_RHIMU
MAFLVRNSTISSYLRSRPLEAGDVLSLTRRGLHSEPGPREKALLAEDPALKQFKSHKKSVRVLKRVGDVLTIVVVAECCYEIYVRAVMREEARRQAKESASLHDEGAS